MPNSSTTVNLFWKSLFGGLPSAEKIEQKENKLIEEKKRYFNLAESEKVKRYNELIPKKDDFEKKKKEVNALTYKNSKLKQKEDRFKSLAKAKDIKIYLKLKDSEKLNFIEKMRNSEKLETYNKLHKQFEDAKSQGKLDDFKLSDDYKKFVELKQDPEIKQYLKIKDARDLKHYVDTKDSDKLANYEQLRKKFEQAQQEGSLKTFKKSDEYRNFKQLSKDPGIKAYYKLKDSGKAKLYEKLHDSDKLAKFLELEKKYKEAKSGGNLKSFQESDAYRKYEELKEDKDIKAYLKYASAKDVAAYYSAEGSDKLKEYQELEAYVNSDEFAKQKEYLLTRDKYKFTEEYKEEQELEALKKDEDIKWYLSKDEKSFDWLSKWNLVFDDDFTGNKLDPEKWLTMYYLGYKQLNSSYSHLDDKHFPTDGNNLELDNSKLRIVTKKEQVSGTAWDPRKGFYPAEFNYTSGVVNTGHAFRQKNGLFQAKIRFDAAEPVIHGFYLSADGMVPHIDVAKFSYKDTKALILNSFTNGNGSVNQHNGRVKGIKPTENYYIYSLEWTPKKLTWKVNDVVVKELTREIPDTEMFVSFGSGVNEDVDAPQLPANMEIDWIKVFKAVE